MGMTDAAIAYVRGEDAPKLPPPASTVGLQGWLRANLFSSPLNSLLTIVFGVLSFMILWRVFNFAIVNAVWTGADREACAAQINGACWPMIADKLPQWVYGFYPIDQRWRVNLCFLAFAAGVIPMLIPSAPHKKWNALYLFLIFPLLTLVLLTGGNLNFGASSYVSLVGFMLLVSAILPLASFGIEEGIARNKIGIVLAALALVVWLASFATGPMPVSIGGSTYSGVGLLLSLLCVSAGVMSLIVTASDGDGLGRPALTAFAIALAGLIAAMLILDVDFGLVTVETSQWGGLLVTLVVSISGIVASLPIGILLALGRRSQMPVVKTLSVIFIEVIRGVPLITVLFMSSVMLPLFLPPGVSFDKLLRALIGVALFSSAYMAEVVRGGLQAIPKGQYEGAMALGLSYSQMMVQIVLPQALKISIPNIVGNFISLFKDTTLVLIVGLFDLLGMVQAGLRDPVWASASSAPTGYLTVALIFWVFCFGMSRYSIFTERRLQTGHKR